MFILLSHDLKSLQIPSLGLLTEPITINYKKSLIIFQDIKVPIIQQVAIVTLFSFFELRINS